MIGRFAPSPTGPLHIGSLLAAVASYLQVKSQGGQWLLRIEDIDTPRQMPGADQAIIDILECHGFSWDGEIVYQSQRLDLYREALKRLQDLDLLYGCQCSRKQIAEHPQAMMGIDGIIYPNICTRLGLSLDQHAVRIRLSKNNFNKNIMFEDLVQAKIEQNLALQVGDFVLRRADGIFSYQLAVVVDDAAQGVTHILRGCDLLDSTPRQIFLQKCLGYPSVEYCHIPIIVNAAGEKLSKQTLAPALQAQHAVANLHQALKLLGQSPPTELMYESLDCLWQWAFQHWNIGKIPARQKIV